MLHMDNRFLTTHSRDLFGLIAGDIIGIGESRKVYRINLSADIVLKVESGGDRFQNVFEWEVWKTVSVTPLAKWFAPCVDISANGIYLVQKRTEPLPITDYPKEIPAILLADLKKENFGLLDGKFVCHDYGTLHIKAINSLLNTKFKKASWWSEN